MGKIKELKHWKGNQKNSQTILLIFAAMYYMKKIFFLSLFIISGKIFAQVNLQSGSATFSLPMFNWQDNKSRLNSIVALNYSSGNGLKVNDVASNVGQGWNLLAGGMITRIQAGEPDDQPQRMGNGTIEDITKYPSGYLYDPVSASLGAPAALISYPIFKDKNHIYKQHNEVAADKELDHFAFQFNGRSGIFILNKPNYDAINNTGVGVFLGDSKMKVTFVTQNNMSYAGDGKGIRTTITSFNIQDENGLIYKFTKHELTKVLKTNYCDKNLNIIKQPKFKNNRVYHEVSVDDNSIVNPYIINGWYLTEIEDALTNRKINFNYPGNRNINTDAGTSLSNFRSDNSGFLTFEKNYSIISHSKSVTIAPQISSITYPDGHNVLLNYGKPRIDVSGDFVLSSIDIRYQGRYLSRYELTTGYFILNRYGNPISDYQKKCARLCLRSVKKIGVDLKADDPPYTFDYFLGTSASYDFIPPPFFHLKDIWGFYNGANSYDGNGNSILFTKALSDLSNSEIKGLCFYTRNNIFSANPGYAKNGLLRQITYPTGGSLNYEYAQNTGIPTGQTTTINVGGVHVSKTSVTDGGYANDCNNPITTNYTYNLDGSALSSLWGLENPINSLTTYNHYRPEYKYVKGKLFPPSVICDFRYKYPGILSKEQAVNISFVGQVLQTAMNIWSTISTIKTILQTMSSGNPVTLIIQIILDLVITCIGDHHVDNETNIYYNSDLTGSNPLPTQFKRVEVMEANGANGKTVYEFTSDADYAIWRQTNPTYAAEQRYAYWAYGLPKKTTLHDVSGIPVKQTENIYDFTKAQTPFHVKASIIYPCCKSLVMQSYSQPNTDWTTQATSYQTVSNGNMLVRMYEPYTGRIELLTTYERVFKPGSASQFLETLTEYTYNSYNYQVSTITTTQSNGDKNFKEINYSGEGYGSSGVLLQNNILNIPVHTATGINKSGQNYYLDEKLTEFTSLANGDVKPSRVLEKRFNQPTVNLNVPYKEIQSFTYDATGNLIGMKDEGNHIVTNIYDYNDKYVVASVVNADPMLDKSAYTSFETNNFGGWVLNGPATYVTPASVTGKRSFTLSSNNLTANLNTAKPYKISFWANNNVTVSGGAALVKSAPTLNGFTYYEYNIAQGTSTVTVSGNANIDELRVYPQTARMRSVTYDPLIGKTSECDENNRVTYYDYDEHGRLRFIKDENRNVIKMYEYNMAKKPTGCPTTYSNLAVSEIFTKQCAVGYVGSDVTYTIPAGTYTSTVSQAAVDIQVQNNLNEFGQAYANTNGTCSQLFYNTALSQTFTKEGCDIGYEGTSITYAVPAGRYTSTISQADADEQAQDDLDANAQAFANLPGNASCVISYTADWIGTGLEQCQNGNKLVQVIDQNPNSSSYNQTQWIDTGSDPNCGSSGCSYNNCSGNDKRCVNGYCETGYRINTGSYYNDNLQRWECIYHYEWSDGYWSGDYSEYSYNPCPLY